jgi:adenine deaminase
MENLAEIIRVAKGEVPADIAIKGGSIVNVLSGEIYEADVAIYGERIVGVGTYSGREEYDATGMYVSPGLIDGHMHLESSMVTVSEFSRTVVPLGTTAIVADPHEIANVLGLEGIHYILHSSKYNPLSVYIMLPSCVPATEFETSGSVLRGFDLFPLLSDKWVLGLGEVMNYPAVLKQDQEVLDKIMMSSEKRVDGHAPGLSGKDLCAYIAVGVGSEHESTTLEEAKEKLRQGMYIMLREGSVTKNLDQLLPLVNEKNSCRFFFVTDDRHPKDLLEEGHIDSMVRRAISFGLDPVTAIRMASVNAAQYFRIDDVGTVAPRYYADIVLADDLKDFRARRVFRRGKLVAEAGEVVADYGSAPELRLRSSINIKYLSIDDFKRSIGGPKVRAIGLIPDQIVTKSLVVDAPSKDGELASDVSKDLLKIGVVERHHASDNIGIGVLSGFGLKKGAVASSVSHDSHNIVVVAENDEDMMAAVIEISKMRGGLAIVVDGELVKGLPLPIGGLMSEEPIAEVKARIEEMDSVLVELGVELDDPLMVLSFLALPVIPDLKITDMGLFDVSKFEFVDLFLDS